MKINPIALALAATLGASSFSAHTNEQNTAKDIEKVVILGQKIERTMFDTKESVALISDQQIDDIALLDLEDAYLSAANVFTLSNGENFGIRGVTQGATSTTGGNGELGSFYIDGVAYTGFSTRFGPRDLWDVQQIEILRGPQSTNVGRQALIGAVVINTKNPDLNGFDAAVRGQLGNLGTYSAEGMVNFALSEHSALRLAVETFDSDGFIHNPSLGIDYNPQRSNLLRGKYLYQPSDDLKVLFTFQYADKALGWDGYRYDLAPIDSYIDSSNLVSEETYQGNAYALDVEYALNDQWQFRSITSGISGDYTRFNDDDAGPEGGDASRRRVVEDDNWAQEFRLSYQSQNLSGVMGLYFTEVDLINNTAGNVSLNPADLGVPDVLLPFYPALLGVDVFLPSESASKNRAFFTEWDWRVNQKLTLSGGFRYDREQQQVLTNAQNSLAPGVSLPDPAQAGAFARQMQFPEQLVAQIVGGITLVNSRLNEQLTPTDNAREDTTFSAFLPQFGATYALTPQANLSLFYKRGYRAGGVDVDTTGDVDDYQAEFLDNLELSYRSVHLDGDLTFNANLYHAWWKDQQVTIFVDGSLFDTETVNAGESTLYGVELESQYQVNSDTLVYASVGIAKTRFDSFCFVDGRSADEINGTICEGGEGIGQDLRGFDFAASPDITASIGAKHYIADRWSISGNVTHQGRAFSDVINTEELRNSSFTLVNFNLGYQVDDFEARLYVRNAFDKFYTNFRGTGVGSPDARIVRPGVPREMGITLSQRF